MITGVQVEIKGTELKKIYQDKAQWCWDQLERCQTIKLELDSKGLLPTDSGEAQEDFFCRTVHDEIRDMRKKWKEYMFLAEHMNEAEVFSFKASEVAQLGIGA